MKTIISMFVAITLAVPFVANAAPSIDAELKKEYAVTQKSDAKLARLLKEQAPKLAAQRTALAARYIELYKLEKQYEKANETYTASCRVIFPREVTCAKQRIALAQRETGIAVLKERIELHKAALLTDERYFNTRLALHEENLRIMTCVESHALLTAGKVLPKGKMAECYRAAERFVRTL